jgi:hypothetical protein
MRPAGALRSLTAYIIYLLASTSCPPETQIISTYFRAPPPQNLLQLDFLHAHQHRASQEQPRPILDCLLCLLLVIFVVESLLHRPLLRRCAQAYLCGMSRVVHFCCAVYRGSQKKHVHVKEKSITLSSFLRARSSLVTSLHSELCPTPLLGRRD